MGWTDRIRMKSVMEEGGLLSTTEVVGSGSGLFGFVGFASLDWVLDNPIEKAEIQCQSLKVYIVCTFGL